MPRDTLAMLRLEAESLLRLADAPSLYNMFERKLSKKSIGIRVLHEFETLNLFTFFLQILTKNLKNDTQKPCQFCCSVPNVIVFDVWSLNKLEAGN